MGGGQDKDNDEDNPPELGPTLGSTLDPQLDDLVRSIHEKPTKTKKTKAKAEAKASELPLRPRMKQSSDEMSNMENVVLTKNQLKNKRKRQKVKEKLKQLKVSHPTTTPATPIDDDSDAVPNLVPISK